MLVSFGRMPKLTSQGPPSDPAHERSDQRVVLILGAGVAERIIALLIEAVIRANGVANLADLRESGTGKTIPISPVSVPAGRTAGVIAILGTQGQERHVIFAADATGAAVTRVAAIEIG